MPTSRDSVNDLNDVNDVNNVNDVNDANDVNDVSHKSKRRRVCVNNSVHRGFSFYNCDVVIHNHFSK